MFPLSAAAFQLDGANILLLDVVAFIFFIITWSGYATYARIHYTRRPNLMFTMDQMRIKWMQQILKRESRVADASLVGNLLRSISFFANTSIFILIGLFTILGYRDSAIEMLNQLPYAVQATPFMWEAKTFTLAMIFIYTFFKFTWSLRQYNYCCILVGAAPMPDQCPEIHARFAEHAGQLSANAGKHFNMAMRGYYFGLATISWFLHPLLFIASTALVIYITYRREFRSATLNSLAGLNEGY
tara:strand:+ start:514 stop:1242 length:729 start_codon:yes stop_codon:yes gene_type:complete